jgi:hypothetical protein
MYRCSTGRSTHGPGHPHQASRRTTPALDHRPLPRDRADICHFLGPGEGGPGSVSRAWSGDARGRPSAHYRLFMELCGSVSTPRILGERRRTEDREPLRNRAAEGGKDRRGQPASSHLVHAACHPEPQSYPADRLRGPRRPARGLTPSENRNGRGAWGSHGRPPREPAEVVAYAAVLLSPRHRLAVPPLERAEGGLSCYPQAGWPSHLVRSRPRCESDRVADRPFALHSEALRRSGWNTRLAPSVWAECSPGSSVLEGREPHDDLP